MKNFKIPEEKPAKLLYDRDKAKKQIEEQIKKGEELLDSAIKTPEDLEDKIESRKLWLDYNKELLSRMFSNDSEKNKFDDSWDLIDTGTPAGDVEFLKNCLRDSISSLRSILERLELIPEEGNNEEARGTRKIGNKVFIVHGRDEEAKQIVARFVESLVLIPIVLHEQPNKGRTIIEKFEDYSDADFAIVILSPDDVGNFNEINEEPKKRARQNVIFELGFFIGKLGRKNVCPLLKGEIERPTDYDGVIYIPLDNAGGWKLTLGKEMKEAGLKVDLNKL